MMDEPNDFGEFLRLLHFEELLRLQRRCEMQNKPGLAEILGDEIVEREMNESKDSYEND